MKLSELKRDMYKEFCDEHGFPHGVKGDFAVITQDECCTEQEYFRFRALMCIGYCDVVSNESFSDIEVPRSAFENELTLSALEHYIALKRMDAFKKETPREEAQAWVLEKLLEKRAALFDVCDSNTQS